MLFNFSFKKIKSKNNYEYTLNWGILFLDLNLIEKSHDLDFLSPSFFKIFFINAGVWVSLCAPRLISRALKLTIMEASSGHHISNHRVRTWDHKKSELPKFLYYYCCCCYYYYFIIIIYVLLFVVVIIFVILSSNNNVC